MGKLIVVEGADAAGKRTQVALLDSALAQMHVGRVEVFDFPQYEGNEFGRLLKRGMQGAFGDWRKIDPYLVALPFMLDRVCARVSILDALIHGIALCNRYTPSNMAYSIANLAPEAWTDFLSFLDRAEHQELGLPKPSLVLFLDVPVAVSAKLMAAEGRQLDANEEDRVYQEKVRDAYLWLCETRTGWERVECTNDGILLTPDAIHARVMTVVRRYVEAWSVAV